MICLYDLFATFASFSKLESKPLFTAIESGKLLEYSSPFMHWNMCYNLNIMVFFCPFRPYSTLPPRLCVQAQRYITQLKSQINILEAELEEQRVQKQRTMVENEQLRMELETVRRRNTEHESVQSNFFEAESEFVQACK